MIKHTELKRLAEAAKRICTLNHKPIKWFEQVELLDGTIDHTDDAAYIAAASPDVVLSMIAEIERHRCGTEVLQRLHDEDMAERNKLRTQNQALLEALKGLQKQYAEHPDAFWDWSQARAAIKLAEGKGV